METRSSILWMTNQMSPKRRNCVLRHYKLKSDTRWNFTALGQFVAILTGTGWYWVSISRYLVLQGQYKAFMPVYIEKGGEFVGFHRCVIDRQTIKYIGLISLFCLNFKLSRAIWESALGLPYQIWNINHKLLNYQKSPCVQLSSGKVIS